MNSEFAEREYEELYAGLEDKDERDFNEVFSAKELKDAFDRTQNMVRERDRYKAALEDIANPEILDDSFAELENVISIAKRALDGN